MAARAPMEQATPGMGEMPRRRNKLDKSTICVLSLVCAGVIFGIFLFVRMVIQPCGCPPGYEMENRRRLDAYLPGRRLQQTGSTCGCEGGVFSCSYTCGEDCFDYGVQRKCTDEESRGFYGEDTDESMDGTDDAEDTSVGGGFTVTCPDYRAEDACQCDTHDCNDAPDDRPSSS